MICVIYMVIYCFVSCRPRVWLTVLSCFQFKHQQLSVNSGDLLNNEQEVLHNDIGSAAGGLQREDEAEEEEKVTVACSGTQM